MEAVCELSLDDRLRVCGVVSGSLISDTPQINYVIERRCISRNINPETKPAARILRCSLSADEKTNNDNFYVLLDPSDRGAVFVLVQNKIGQLEPHARLTKVGALLNPMGEELDLDKRATKRKKTETAEEEERVVAETMKYKSKRRALKGAAKKRKLSQPGQNDEESSDSSDTDWHRMRLMIDLNYLPGEAPRIHGDTKEYKARRSPKKGTGRMTQTELKERLRGIWRSYNPKYRNLMSARAY